MLLFKAIKNKRPLEHVNFFYVNAVIIRMKKKHLKDWFCLALIAG